MEYDKIELSLQREQWWVSFTLRGKLVFEGWFGLADRPPGKYLDHLIRENDLRAVEVRY